MNKPMLTRAVRDTLEMQSAAARFFTELARQSLDARANKFLIDIARIERLLSIELESKAAELTNAPLPELANKRVAAVKTAPEWSGVRTITFEQAIAVALDCTRRAFHHHAAMAVHFDGRASDFFLAFAQADEDRASMLEDALDARLTELAGARTENQIIAGTLEAIRRAGKAYARIAERTSRARTQEFLKGMVEVCSLHAANIQSRVSDTPVFDEEDPMFDGLIIATSPKLDRNVEDLDFASAMRMAMDAQNRAALMHSMQASAFRGELATLLVGVAEAERKHAATIAAVLDRLVPAARPLDTELVSPLDDAACESWTGPAGTIEQIEDAYATPSLRLVAG